MFPRPDPERIDLAALKTDIECVMWQIGKAASGPGPCRRLDRARALRSGDRRHRDVVAVRPGVRLELTELPMPKSSKASGASVKSKSDRNRRQTAVT
jgi:hypothetical protein